MAKKTIYLLLIFIFSTCNFSKDTSGLKSNKNHPVFRETDDFGIRVKPILNREYLIFLSWYISVYGESYPEKVISILPKNSFNSNFGSGFEIGERLKTSTSILKNYILNPKYIDYPLIGLSIPQIMEMQRWLSDRYNENVLIDKGFLNFNPNQKDEDCFSMETFLIDQYIGAIRKTPSKRSWKKEYLPTFRLPFQEEINTIKSYSPFDTRLKKYPFGRKDFLWKWNKHFIKVIPKEKKIILKSPYNSIELICENDFTLNKTFTDATLSDKYLDMGNTKYLDMGNPEESAGQYGDKYPYLEKNRFGQMEFVVVGINDENRPIIADVLKLKNKDLPDNKIFRICFNKTLESKYLPK
jgi:hypothetical protein